MTIPMLMARLDAMRCRCGATVFAHPHPRCKFPVVDSGPDWVELLVACAIAALFVALLYMEVGP